MRAVLKIDTKGTCLLCLSTKNCPLSKDTEKNGASSSAALKMLLRYLKVDVRNLNPISSLLESFSGDNVNLAVSLCEDCSSAANDFLDLYHAMESIRLQLDLCVRQIHEFMENGRNNLDRVWDYEKIMAGENGNDLISWRTAESLRAEIDEKIFHKLKLSLPRITVDNSSCQIERASAGSPLILSEELDQLAPVSPESPIVSEQLQPELDNEKYVNGEGSREQSASAAAVEHEQLQISLSKCAYCGKWFSQQKNLQAHQFQKHTLEVLSDQGFLPSNISQRRLETVLESIVIQMKSRVAKCPFCKRRGFHSEHHVRQHLLQRHLPYLVEKAEGASTELEALPPPDKVEHNPRKRRVYSGTCAKSKLKKCIYCGKRLQTRSGMRRHQLREHTMLTLRNKIPESVSEQMMTAALTGILKRARTTSTQNGGRQLRCNFCKRGNCWFLKGHLISHHLDEVIREARGKPSSPSDQLSLQASVKDMSHTSSPNAISSSSQLSTSSKHKCTICGKLTCTKLQLKMHFAKEHLRPTVKHFKCEHCQGSFASPKHLRVHKIRYHPVASFRNRLPSGISDQDFFDAVSSIVRKSEAKLDRKMSRERKLTLENYVMECPHCNKRCSKMAEFRLHISNSHLKEVIEAIKFNLETKYKGY